MAVRRGIAADVADRESAARLLKAIVDMFDAWVSVRLDVEKARGVAQTYASQVEHLPLWAIKSGISECQGRKNPFPPSAGELRAACEKQLVPLQNELAQLSRVLDAEVYQQNSAVEHERLLEGYAALQADLRKTNGFTPPTEKPKAPVERTDDARAGTKQFAPGDPLPPMSDRLRSVLGFRAVDETEAR